MTLRLAFVGNCQVAGLRAAAKLLRPDIQIDSYHINVPLSAAEIAERITGYDTVVTQIREGDERHGALAPSAVSSRVFSVIPIPAFVFRGLHPDMIYISRDGGHVPGPFSETHSLIVVASFLLGFSEKRTLGLFNAYIFAELGYFTPYQASYEMIVRQFDEAGFDMRGKPELWLRDYGSFMHTVNHPAIVVLSQLATDILKRAELIAQDVAPPSDVVDGLYDALVAPVFAPLARRIGLPGNDVFLKPARLGPDRELRLADFVRESFAFYRAMPSDILQGAAIEQACDKLKAILP